jgi:hypothetical protein
MQTRDLTEQANQAVYALAQRYNVSVDAVRTLLYAVSAGNGSMAQFYHPDLGGGGQWMQGGMTMVGDMFNSGLQATVAGLCSELSNLLASQPVFAPLPVQSQGQGQGGMSGGMQSFGSYNSFWPAEFGSPSSSGGQNDSRYAYFPQQRRLVIDRAGQILIYDTLDHQIGGVQQQQGGPSGSLSFSSQYGTFTVESLPLAAPQGAPQAPPPFQPPAPEPYQAPAPSFSGSAPQRGPLEQREIFEALDKLGDLRDRGILSDEEFRAKKSELLSRL